MFLTGKYGGEGIGAAYRGELCNSNKQDRISISQYFKDDMYTAEVRSFFNYVYPMNLSKYIFVTLLTDYYPRNRT